jgi:hypothetical protein
MTSNSRMPTPASFRPSRPDETLRDMADYLPSAKKKDEAGATASFRIRRFFRHSEAAGRAD